MTADLIHNGPQPGSEPDCPSQVRANYDYDIPSATLTFDGNKGGVRNLGAVERHSPGGVNAKERIYSLDETENRKSSPGSKCPARRIKSKDGGEDVQELVARGRVLVQAGDSDQLDSPTSFSGKARNLPSQMDEAGGDADDELENADEAETKPSMACKPQVATTAPQLQQFQQSHLQYPQQEISGGGWENFLPQRNLRVLLVEDDDSTRHVVGALLRNCGYEVTSAASDVLAWELLQDKNSHFDLSLTDVMLPTLSGITLLAKIMNQESCKQIPVIMMSSLDSVDIVFKCLSKGAVDFLVKPVRKNELKNLWQHVWRKCHSSTGSGSGGGNRTGKVAGLKNMNDIAKNSGSNDNDSSSLNPGGGSDNGSGTQNFWRKKVEVESPRRTIDWDVARRPLGAYTHAEGHKNSGMLPKDRKRSSIDAMRGQTSIQAKAPDHVLGNNLGITASRTGVLEFQVINNGHSKDANRALQEVTSSEDVEQNEWLDEEGIRDRAAAAALEAETAAINLLGNIACRHLSKEHQRCSGDGDNLDRSASNSPTKDNASGSISLPTLELSLKRSHAEEEEGKVEDRHVLRQSGPSAFSRYSNTGAGLQQHPHFLVGPFALGSCPPQGGGYVRNSTTPVTSMGPNQIGGLCIATPGYRAGPFKVLGEVSASLPLHSQLACIANNQDMNPSVVGASEQEVQAAKEEGASGSGMPNSIAVPTHAMLSFDGVGAFGTSMHPVFYTSSKSPWAAFSLPDRAEAYTNHQFEDHDLPLQSHQRNYHHYSHHYHHHHVRHHYHHHHAHVNSGSPESPEDEQTVTNPGTGAPQCGSSNMMGAVPGNLGQSGSSNGYDVNGNGNGSASGSNNGSNNHNVNRNGQSGIMATAGANGDSGNNNGNSGSGNDNVISSVNGRSGSGVVIGPEQNCFTRREAALNKFREKRKERCFEKKVRYQSRKKLAEQRPRVRGQFVRQAGTVQSIADQGHGNNEYNLADSDYDVADAERD
ncbi:hypothetical protein O6H91_03G124400 [Diphasiastrum complanatum]|uniref:Uncharacterized protein n=2 Tax=Diphasiastrum complanatum TaxID=34168 RepID=A0ACC2EB72_DIPCM|nr:hypothetical protein O6H91_14G021000 [Diphasiastrum complanatum]KAJ7563746.1 hypothetical protein O6H91_03G124400 [Diphasiastrum complanatum]